MFSTAIIGQQQSEEGSCTVNHETHFIERIVEASCDFLQRLFLFLGFRANDSVQVKAQRSGIVTKPVLHIRPRLLIDKAFHTHNGVGSFLGTFRCLSRGQVLNEESLFLREVRVSCFVSILSTGCYSLPKMSTHQKRCVHKSSESASKRKMKAKSKPPRTIYISIMKALNA